MQRLSHQWRPLAAEGTRLNQEGYAPCPPLMDNQLGKMYASASTLSLPHQTQRSQTQRKEEQLSSLHFTPYLKVLG